MSDVLDDGLTFTDSQTPTGGGGSSYVLPVATTTALGGVKPDGTTITATADGTITSTPSGGGPAYVLPIASFSTLGGVTVDGTTITADPSGRPLALALCNAVRELTARVAALEAAAAP